MPPLKGIDRGLTGRALKALEESGHGRRIAIVDASYNIPRWAEVVDYRGETSQQALLGILRLIPFEGSIGLMMSDEDDTSDGLGDRGAFYQEAGDALYDELGDPSTDLLYRLDTEEESGFYTVANNQTEDTLFIRTQDRLPYACATMIIGHMQVEE